MARFLRDEEVANLTIDPEAVSYLVDVFANRGTTMPEYVRRDADQAADVFFLSYTIRFDGKGYRCFEKDQLLQYFEQATEVERIVFELTSAEALRTNRVLGSFMDLRLDKDEAAKCYITVSSEDEDWVNGSFSAARESLQKYQNRNSLVRNPWINFLIQLTGLFLGFVVSLWGASKISPRLSIENAFLISFILVLLVFSNLWTPITQRIHAVVYRTFPKIRFYRPDTEKLHWLYQAVVGGLVVAIGLYLLGIAFSYVGDMLGGFVGDGA